MKPDFYTKLFDEYAWKARVLPVLITVAPTALVGLALHALDAISTAYSVFGAFGLLFLASQITRSRGKKLETRLVKQWDGLPTTRMLRFRTQQNGPQFVRRRQKMEIVLNLALPTKRQEKLNSIGADEVYVAATKTLISKVRQHREHFPRVHEENINYGFRRNLLALKPFALTILVFVLIVLTVLAMTVSQLLIAGLALVLLGNAWLFFIRSAWVEDAANSYAERLFETLESGSEYLSSPTESRP